MRLERPINIKNNAVANIELTCDLYFPQQGHQEKNRPYYIVLPATPEIKSDLINTKNHNITDLA